MSKFTVLSLGAGVQSTTILLMAIKGQLPKPDIAIFADTGAESQATYAHLAWLTKLAGENSIPIVTIKHSDLYDDYLNAIELGKSYVTLPIHTLDRCGGKGILPRQCTKYYKIMPVRREIRKWLCIKPHERIPAEAVDLWIGISSDEARRMLSYKRDTQWLVPQFPLITIKYMSRTDCLDWLGHYYPNISVPRSSCVVCPYHINKVWRELCSNDWYMATQFDELIRNGIKSHKTSLYLHSSCQPLAEVDLRTPEEHGQLVLPNFKIQKLNQFASMEEFVNG